MLSAKGFKHDIQGDGEPVLFIHGAHIADSYLSLGAEPALALFRRVTYRRRGYDGSPRHTGPFSIKEQAQDALDLLSDLGIERAHVVGHSSGGLIALQMALTDPGAVRSLVLLEPALMMVPSAPGFFEAVAPAIDKYNAGDAAGAVGAFINLVAEPDWRTEVPRMVPGGLEQAEKDAATFFEIELPSLGAWSFDRGEASEITQPVLFVIGTESGSLFQEGKKLCQAWIPQTKEFSVQGANHLLQFQDPSCSAQIARGMAEFLPRDRIAA